MAQLPAEVWWAMPETARERVLVLLARLIARGVIEKEEEPDD